MTVLSITVGFLVGALFAAWRLKGARTMREAITVVIQGGGGPGPRQ